MTKQLTQEAIERYVRTAAHCPFCESERIQAGAVEREDSCTEMTQDVECLDCGREWREVYRVVDLEWAGDDEWAEYPGTDDQRPDPAAILAAGPALLAAAREVLDVADGDIYSDAKEIAPTVAQMWDAIENLKAAVARAEGSE